MGLGLGSDTERDKLGGLEGGGRGKVGGGLGPHIVTLDHGGREEGTPMPPASLGPSGSCVVQSGIWGHTT